MENELGSQTFIGEASSRKRAFLLDFMTLREREQFSWMDLLWLAFLAGLAVLPPIQEVHKQLILLAIGVLQLLEGRLIAYLPTRGRSYA
ncbi:MAG: hypothetical protein WA766_02305, partial [Candidatus Acidiferrales bacterium]